MNDLMVKEADLEKETMSERLKLPSERLGTEKGRVDEVYETLLPCLLGMQIALGWRSPPN